MKGNDHMEIISEGMPSTAPAPQSLPRFADGTINMQELIRSMAEMLTNEIMSAEADQLCESTGNNRNGYRERKLVTCVGTLTLRIPKLRSGSFFPEDVIERYQRVDRAVAAAVNEMYATGTSTRKVAKVAAAMGIERLSKDQVSAMVSGLDADNEELLGRDLSGLRMPYLWLDATYVKCRTGAHVASVAVVTAIGCDEDGWRHVLGLDVVDTESHDSWLGFLQGLRERGVHGVELVTSDAHTGLKGAIAEVFQGAAWQRCVVHLIRNCTREAGRGASPGGSPGSWRRSSVPRTPTPSGPCTTSRARCWRPAAPGPRRSWRRPSQTPWPTSTSPRATGKGSGPTTSRSAPTARSSAEAASCRCSPRRGPCSGWRGR